MPREIPRARPAHRDAGDVDPPSIAVELADRLLERCKRLQLHVAVPLLTVAALREKDDRFVAIAETFERWSESDTQLAQIVVAALAAAVQKKNHRPASQSRVMRGQPHAIFVLMVAERDAAFEELRFLCARGDEDHHRDTESTELHSNRSYSAGTGVCCSARSEVHVAKM